MKLIKIGRSSACDINLPSSKVSAIHAEILVLDDGDIILEDKNSTNGTYVNQVKIVPNQEVKIKRGDRIVFGDTILSWARIPQSEMMSGYKMYDNIGTNYRNTIILENDFSSRFHAVVKKDDKNKVYIKDLNSKNGVRVNGNKIHPNQDYQIKKGDIVVCGEEDVTLLLQKYYPNNPLNYIVSIAAILTMVLAVGYFLIGGIGRKIEPKEMIPAVVYVYTQYHWTATFQDNPIQNEWGGVLDLEKWKASTEGTAFFIDRDGRMATNRHVALPWLYDADTENVVRTGVSLWLDDQLAGLTQVRTSADFNSLNSTELGQKLINSVNSLQALNSYISRLRNSQINVSAIVDYRWIGYPENYYTNPVLEMQACSLVKESGSEELDIAILQLNNRHTPDEIKYVFDVKKFNTKTLEPGPQEYHKIGYPKGLQWGMTNSNLLQSTVESAKCSKNPSNNEFEFTGNVIGGESGSPIFGEKGDLIGILWGGRSTGTTGKGVLSIRLKEMYNQLVP